MQFKSVFASLAQWFSRREALAWTFALALCAASGAAAYAAFLAHPEDRWGSIANDRNYHYLVGLQLGLDLRSLDVAGFLSDLSRVRTWPPFFHLCVAAAVAVAGPRYEAAVLVSLLAWLGTALVAFQLARRLAPSGKNAAGLIALIFVLASPTHRVFATDLLLESLGAFLTLLAMERYIARRQSAPGELGMSRSLAVVLTLLFFEKYNYWLLAVLAIGSCEAWRWRREWSPWAAGALRDPRARTWLVRQIVEPLNLPIVVCGGLALAAMATGGLDLAVAGRTLHLEQSSKNLWHAVFILFVLRVAVRWPREGRALWNGLPEPAREFARWHLVPMSAWFLLPKRFGYFVWYISPLNGANSTEGFFAGLRYYAECAAAHFHANYSAALLAVLGLVLAARLWRRLPTPSLALVLLLAFGLALSAKHPNRKSRFLHTWLPAAWVLAGAGLGSLAAHRRRDDSSATGAWRPVLAAGAVAGVALVQGPALWGEGASPEDGHAPGPSALALARTYLPWLDEPGPVGLMANLPAQPFLEWTYREQYPRRPAAHALYHLPGGPDDADGRLGAWIERTGCREVVLVEVDRRSPFYFEDFEDLLEVGAQLRRQPNMVEVRSERRDDLRCRVSLWRRVQTAAQPAAPPR